MPSFEVVTIANAAPVEPHYIFDKMVRSCQRGGSQPTVLGWGKPWGGLGSKPRILKEGIESGKVKSDIIIFVDAFDVVFAAPPRDIALKFYQQKSSGVIWGAERNFWHRNWEENYRSMDELIPHFPKTEAGFNFLNSGFCVAYANDMWRLLKDMNVDAIPDDHHDGTKACHPCDQSYYGRAFCKANQVVPQSLDTNCEYVVNLHSVKKEELDFSEERIRLIPTGTYPMTFHFNGGAKTDGLMGSIIDKLQLN